MLRVVHATAARWDGATRAAATTARNADIPAPAGISACSKSSSGYQAASQNAGLGSSDDQHGATRLMNRKKPTKKAKYHAPTALGTTSSQRTVLVRRIT